MPNNRFWLLIARKLSGEADERDLDELRQLIQESPDRQYLTEILHSYFTKAKDLPETASDVSQADDRFSRLINAIEKKPAANASGHVKERARVAGLSRMILKYAAITAGICIIGWLTYYFTQTAKETNKPAITNAEVVAGAGARTRIVLPDSSQVWLNSGSRLRYTKNFTGSRREVYLDGEAFFDVVRNAGRLFIVHTAGIDVRVLGTTFTVKSYPLESTIETTLLKGSIEVVRQDVLNAPKVILNPNEKLTFKRAIPQPSEGSGPSAKTINHLRPAESSISISAVPGNLPDSSKAETSWLYNRLVFNGDSFSELAVKMERWYNVRIRFLDEDLGNYHFKGVFDNESVEEALDALQLTANFKYKISENEVNIFSEKSKHQLNP